MHETFHKDNPEYIPQLVCWANTIFGELILKVVKEHPAVLGEPI